MQVKLWNDNVHPYRERFKGDEIVIKPKDFILMEFDDAVVFRGTMNNVEFDVSGVPKPESYKMLRIEKIDGQVETPKVPAIDPNKCQACGKVFTSQGEMANHIFEQHPESMAPESRDEAVAALTKMKAGKK